MAIVFKNNASTTLSAALSSAATSISVADATKLPSITGDEYFFCTIDDGSNVEIVKVTGISSNTLTVVRAQDNTTALSFSSGDTIEQRLTAAVLETFPQLDVGELTADEFIGDLRGAVIFKAQAGEAIDKGEVVYVSGISGNTPVVALADADDANKMPAFGLALESATLNTTLAVVTFGTISGVDTDTPGFSLGDTLYVSTTPGALTNSKPTGESSLIQNIGKVQRVHVSSGSIKVGGAGRSNDTPNLNDGNIFIGNASNQTTTASLNTKIEDYLDANGLTLPDDVKAQFGNSNDLQIFTLSSNGNAIIRETGGGNLSIQTNGPQIGFYDTTNNQSLAEFATGGGVNLRHNGDSKFTTTSTGIDITGTVVSDGLTVAGNTTFNTGDVLFTGASANILFDQSANALEFGDNAKAQFGASNDLQIYHDGSNSYINESGTGGLIIKSGGTMQFNSPADEKMIRALANGGVELYYDNDKKFETTSDGVSVSGAITTSGDIDLTGTSDTSSEKIMLPRSGYIAFYGNTDLSHAISSMGTDDIRINSYGEIILNLDSNENQTSAANFRIIKHGGGSSAGTSVFTVDGENGNTTLTGDLLLPGGGSTIEFGSSGQGGPHGLNFTDDDGSTVFRALYRTSPNTFTFEDSSESIKHTFDLSGNYTSAGTITSGSDIFVGAMLKMDGGSTNPISFMGTGSDANYRNFAYEDSDHHYVTNRHINGRLHLMSNNGSGGGELTRITLQAGSGTQDIDITNANLDLNSNNIKGVGTINSGAITSTGEVEATALDINGNGDISGNLTLGGYLAGPATFTIDPAAVGDNTGTVVIAGNLQVDGTTTTVNSTTVNVSDKNIMLGYDATTDAANNQAGIIVYRPETSNAQILWSETNGRFEINRKLNISQNFTIDASGTNDTMVEIGAGTASNHYAYIDLIGDATYTDYGLRIIRNNSGANTTSVIYHRGTGDFVLETQEAANLKLRTSGADALTIGTTLIDMELPLDMNDSYITGVNSYRNVNGTEIIDSNNPSYTILKSYAGATRLWLGETATYLNNTNFYFRDASSVHLLTLNTSGLNIRTAAGGLLIEGTEVITGSGNLTNIGTITSSGAANIDGAVQVGDTVSQNYYGLLQVNQEANNDESGIGILSSGHTRSMRIWVDESNSYINSGNGGSGNLVFNEAITVSSGGNLTGVGTINSGAITCGAIDATISGEEVIRVNTTGDTAAIHWRDSDVIRGLMGFSNGSSIYTGADNHDMVIRSESKLHLVSNVSNLGITLNGGNATFGGTISSGAITSTGNVTTPGVILDGTGAASYDAELKHITRGNGQAQDSAVDSTQDIYLAYHPSSYVDLAGNQTYSSATEVSQTFTIGETSGSRWYAKVKMYDPQTANDPVVCVNDGTEHQLRYENAVNGSATDDSNVWTVVDITDDVVDGSNTIKVYLKSGQKAYFIALYVFSSGGLHLPNEPYELPVYSDQGFGVEDQLIITKARNIQNIGTITATDLLIDTDVIVTDSTNDRVGINKTSPATTLDVGGSIYFSSILRATGDGSAATPSIQPGNDGDTGLYRPATNQIGFTTGGTNALTLDASQNATFAGDISAVKGTFTQSGGSFPLVTSTPYDFTAKFESTDAGGYIVLEDSTSTNNANYIGVNGNDFKIYTAGALGLTINSSQNATFAGTIDSGAITSSGASTFSSNVNIDRELRLDARYDGGSGDNVLAFKDSSGNYSIRQNVNDGNGNYSISLGYSGTGSGQYAVTGDGVSKILFSGHGQDGGVSLNAAQTGTAGNNISFSIGLLVESADNTIRVGASNNGTGLDASEGVKVFDASANAFATSYSVGSNTVIDSSSNLTNIGTISSSNIVVTTSSDGEVGLEIRRASSTGRAQLTIADESGGDLWRIGATGPGSTDFAFFDGGANVLTLASSTNNATFAEDVISNGLTIGSWGIGSNTGQGRIGKASDRNAGTITNQIGGGSSANWEIVDYAWSVVAAQCNNSGDFTAYRDFNTNTGGYEISGTTVIDSSRQLTNIAKILGNSSSGGTTTFNVGRGDVYFENNSYSNANGAGITLRTSSNPSGDSSIFEVRSSGQAARLFVGQGLTSSGYNPFYVGTAVTGGEGTASNYAIELAENGNITAEGNITAYGTVSDIRQKENIEQIDKPIERLEKIKGITFNYKKKSEDERLMGVIAQDLLKDDILKLAVYEQEDFKAADDDPLKHTYGVRYEHLTAILIEAVKEQQEQIESLKSEINNLKGEK